MADRTARARGVLVAAVLLVLAGAVLGLLAGVVGGKLLGSVKVADSAPPPALAASPVTTPGPSGSGPASAPSAAESPGEAASPTPSEAGSTGPSALTALADTVAARSGQRITITGFYTGAPEGTLLQVQRKVGNGDWRDFPATTRTDADGGFDVWMRTGVKGPQQLRVMDKAADVASDPILVTID